MSDDTPLYLLKVPINGEIETITITRREHNFLQKLKECKTAKEAAEKAGLWKQAEKDMSKILREKFDVPNFYCVLLLYGEHYPTRIMPDSESTEA